MDMTDAERQVYEEEIDAAYDAMWKAKRNFVFAMIFALTVSMFLFLAQVKLHNNPTWQEVVKAMPDEIKKDIAIKVVCTDRTWRGSTN